MVNLNNGHIANMALRILYLLLSIALLGSCGINPEGHPRPKSYIISQPEKQTTKQLSQNKP